MILQDTTEPVDVLRAVLASQNRGSARSAQKTIGPSQVGGCRAQVWLQLNGFPAQQGTKQAAAWMGTSIHDRIADGLRGLDPFGDRFLIEHRVAADRGVGLLPLKGTVDAFDTLTGTVIDWKSTKKSSLGWLSKGATLGASADRWPDSQQMWQVHLYGWLLGQAGHEVKRVSLVGIARDGDEDHFRQWDEPYSVDKAVTALAWLDDVAGSTVQPAGEKPASFCRSYCKFYTEDGSVCAGAV